MKLRAHWMQWQKVYLKAPNKALLPDKFSAALQICRKAQHWAKLVKPPLPLGWGGFTNATQIEEDLTEIEHRVLLQRGMAQLPEDEQQN